MYQTISWPGPVPGITWLFVSVQDVSSQILLRMDTDFVAAFRLCAKLQQMLPIHVHITICMCPELHPHYYPTWKIAVGFTEWGVDGVHWISHLCTTLSVVSVVGVDDSLQPHGNKLYVQTGQ